MDPSIASFLMLGFLVALGLTLYEMRTSLGAPVCAECSHCRALALAKEREQAELQEQYAKRWNLSDEEDRRRRP